MPSGICMSGGAGTHALRHRFAFQRCPGAHPERCRHQCGKSARAHSGTDTSVYRRCCENTKPGGTRNCADGFFFDLAKPVQSPISRLVRKNLIKASGQESRCRPFRDFDQAAMINESVGVSRMVALVMAPLGEGSVSSGVFTLVSSAMGAGCLSLPFMFKRIGVIPGILMLVVGAILAHLSLLVIMSCARYTESDTFAQLVALTRGGGRGRIVDFVIAVYSIAAVICYLIFVGDFFSGIVRSPTIDLHLSRKTLIIVLSLLVVWPLSLPRSLTALRHICVLGVLAICVTAMAVVCKAPGYMRSHGGVPSGRTEAFDGVAGYDEVDSLWAINWWSSDPGAWLQSFSIALFAFAAHTNAVPVATSLRRADGSTIWRVSFYSVCIELLFYVLMGLGGYLSFRGHTKQDFVLNYRNDDTAMFVVRCIYGVVVCLGAPINLSPAASSILGLLSPVPLTLPKTIGDAASGAGSGRLLRRSWAAHCAVASVIVLFSVCVSLWSQQVADVIALIGSSFGSLIVLAWPAVIYRRVLFELHPPGLARVVLGALAAAAALGVTAFVFQLREAIFAY
eukprot:TRINITY_DN38221_c0_g1_i1.p1 TRINITY_DN38221_c0_g1~~TRINITY_DN38221_c0_g1_i1.p1  ORF type:complete len:602 (+),score=82.10 TRINITY_DN38221_c0_g1_i1:112-1806(+)